MTSLQILELPYSPPHKRATAIRPKSELFHELSYIEGISFEGHIRE